MLCGSALCSEDDSDTARRPCMMYWRHGLHGFEFMYIHMHVVINTQIIAPGHINLKSLNLRHLYVHVSGCNIGLASYLMARADKYQCYSAERVNAKFCE